MLEGPRVALRGMALRWRRGPALRYRSIVGAPVEPEGLCTRGCPRKGSFVAIQEVHEALYPRMSAQRAFTYATTT